MSKEESEKKKTSKADKKAITPSRPKQRPPSIIEPYRYTPIWRDFDKLFEDYRKDLEELLWPSRSLLDRAYSMVPRLREEWPVMEFEDRGSDFCLTVELPGFKKEDVEIEIEDRAVDIKASTERRHEEKTEKYTRSERAARSFHRRVVLPEEIVADKVEAKLDDGVLELIMPKKTPKKRRKIEIK